MPRSSTYVFEYLKLRITKCRPESILLVAGLIFGSVLTFLTPPFNVGDEPNHFYRAYQISEFKFGPQHNTDQLPASLSNLAQKFNQGIIFNDDGKVAPDAIYASLSTPLRPRTTAQVSLPNTINYSPVAYIPQSAVIGLGRLIHLPALQIFYLIRFANLFVWLILGYFAIRIMPNGGKWTYLALLLMPISIFYAASVTPEGITLGTTLLALAALLRARSTRSVLLQKNWIALGIIFTILALLKPPYFLIVLLALQLPERIFVSSRQQKIRVWGIIGWTFLVATLWTLYAHHYYVPARTDILISPTLQIRYMLSHIPTMVWLFFKTFLVQSQDTLYSFPLGWLDTFLPLWSVIIWYLILGMSLIKDAQENELLLDLRLILMVGGIALCQLVLIDVLLYTTWNAIGNQIISGLQTRYFVPLLAFLPILLTNGIRKNVGSGSLDANYIVGGHVIVLLTTVLTVYLRYYVS